MDELIIVAGHAAFKAHVDGTVADVESDDVWALRPYQVGEVPSLLEHIRQGVMLAHENANALLLFSGGHTSASSGTWSEGQTYLSVAAARGWWCADARVREAMASRAAAEEFARDSFENVLFSICRFHQLAGTYPHRVSVVSWGFKKDRFDYHRAVLRLPTASYRFLGPNDPPDRETAVSGEAKTLQEFFTDPYGSGGQLAAKRASRDALGRQHAYDRCPGMAEFFEFLRRPPGEGQQFDGVLPWERRD